MKIKTASDLKYQYQLNNPDGHFFDRETMRFFGDTMRNYGVRSKPVKVSRSDGEIVECYVLYRRHAVKHGLQSDRYFDVNTFKDIHGDIVE
jgi:hypothetical protein